jgi:hypothetical protein
MLFTSIIGYGQPRARVRVAPPYLGGLRAVQGHHGEERFLNAMANHGGPIYASYTNRF